MSDDWEARALKAEEAANKYCDIGLEVEGKLYETQDKLAAAEKERDEAIKSAQSASFNNSMTAGEGLVVAAKLKALQEALGSALDDFDYAKCECVDIGDGQGTIHTCPCCRGSVKIREALEALSTKPADSEGGE